MASTVYTMQNVLDAARIPLNDSAKVRYPDAELLGYANDAILRIRNLRPDLFVGGWLALPINNLATDMFPIRDEFKPIVQDYVTGRAEAKEDEFTDDNRSGQFLVEFEKALMNV